MRTCLLRSVVGASSHCHDAGGVARRSSTGSYHHQASESDHLVSLTFELCRSAGEGLLELSSSGSEVQLSELGTEAAQAIWRNQLTTQLTDGYIVAEGSLQKTDGAQHENVTAILSSAFDEILRQVAAFVEQLGARTHVPCTPRRNALCTRVAAVPCDSAAAFCNVAAPAH